VNSLYRLFLSCGVEAITLAAILCASWAVGTLYQRTKTLKHIEPPAHLLKECLQMDMERDSKYFWLLKITSGYTRVF